MPEHVDVLIIGAGLSGIGAACHLTQQLPHKRYVIVEARDAIGGTWDLFRYPGIRSDSDMFTLGYGFRPWDGAESIASGGAIRTYIERTADAYDVTPHIRFGRRVTALSWDSATARWTATIDHAGSTEQVTADFVHGCTGYYRYDEGYLPDFPGMEQFAGTLVHPQHWPEDLDVTGQRVVVIGSGATAVTLVPSLAAQAGHVTMLQRSPTYVISLPARDVIADVLRRLLPARAAHAVITWKNLVMSWLFFRLSRVRPGVVKAALRKQYERLLPDGFDIDTHFTPRYDPWDQRVCLVPDADLFDALGSGAASVVTDTIETFTPTGLALTSGEHLEADVIVTATGLNLLMMGGIAFTVDGEPVDVSACVAYKAMMLSGVPNFAFTVGYTNASWTLKADMVAAYVCRLLAHMDATGRPIVRPQRPDPSEPVAPMNTLTSGYIQRSLHLLPKSGARAPWLLRENYFADRRLFRAGLQDEGIRFERPSPAATEQPQADQVA